MTVCGACDVQLSLDELIKGQAGAEVLYGLQAPSPELMHFYFIMSAAPVCVCVQHVCMYSMYACVHMYFHLKETVCMLVCATCFPETFSCNMDVSECS